MGSPISPTYPSCSAPSPFSSGSSTSCAAQSPISDSSEPFVSFAGQPKLVSHQQPTFTDPIMGMREDSGLTLTSSLSFAFEDQGCLLSAFDYIEGGWIDQETLQCSLLDQGAKGKRSPPVLQNSPNHPFTTFSISQPYESENEYSDVNDNRVGMAIPSSSLHASVMSSHDPHTERLPIATSNTSPVMTAVHSPTPMSWFSRKEDFFPSEHSKRPSISPQPHHHIPYVEPHIQIPINHPSPPSSISMSLPPCNSHTYYFHVNQRRRSSDYVSPISIESHSSTSPFLGPINDKAAWRLDSASVPLKATQPSSNSSSSTIPSIDESTIAAERPLPSHRCKTSGSLLQNPARSADYSHRIITPFGSGPDPDQGSTEMKIKQESPLIHTSSGFSRNNARPPHTHPTAFLHPPATVQPARPSRPSPPGSSSSSIGTGINPPSSVVHAHIFNLSDPSTVLTKQPNTVAVNRDELAQSRSVSSPVQYFDLGSTNAPADQQQHQLQYFDEGSLSAAGIIKATSSSSPHGIQGTATATTYYEGSSGGMSTSMTSPPYEHQGDVVMSMTNAFLKDPSGSYGHAADIRLQGHMRPSPLPLPTSQLSHWGTEMPAHQHSSPSTSSSSSLHPPYQQHPQQHHHHHQQQHSQDRSSRTSYDSSPVAYHSSSTSSFTSSVPTPASSIAAQHPGSDGSSPFIQVVHSRGSSGQSDFDMDSGGRQARFEYPLRQAPTQAQVLNHPDHQSFFLNNQQHPQQHQQQHHIKQDSHSDRSEHSYEIEMEDCVDDREVAVDQDRGYPHADSEFMIHVPVQAQRPRMDRLSTQHPQGPVARPPHQPRRHTDYLASSSLPSSATTFGSEFDHSSMVNGTSSLGFSHSQESTETYMDHSTISLSTATSDITATGSGYSSGRSSYSPNANTFDSEPGPSYSMPSPPNMMYSQPTLGGSLPRRSSASSVSVSPAAMMAAATPSLQPRVLSGTGAAKRRVRASGSLPIPVPVPNLTKKSRGRRVPTLEDLQDQSQEGDEDDTLLGGSGGTASTITASATMAAELHSASSVYTLEEDGGGEGFGEDAIAISNLGERKQITGFALEEGHLGDGGGRRGRTSAAGGGHDGSGVASLSAASGKATRPYRCMVDGCGKMFARGEHLKRHVRSIHTYEKPHLCPYPGCGKDFSRHDNLGQHMRVHKDYVPPRKK